MKIIAVTDRGQCIRPFTEQIKLIVSAGADMLVLREKDLSGEEYTRLASEIGNICEGTSTEFCISTFSGIAAKLGVKTVWIPYRDLVDKGRPDIEKVGVSVHSEAEAYDAADRGADFIVYGNVFETTCKPGKEGKGLDEIRKISVNSGVWVYAIGGIGEHNLQQIHDCGVDGVCIMSGFMKAENPSELVGKSRSLLE